MCSAFTTSLHITKGLQRKMSNAKNVFFDAIYKGDILEVDKMLRTGQVTVNTVNNDDSPLHVAANAGRFKLVKYLVEEHNADVNAKDSKGKLPLEVAVEKYNGAIARFLVKHNSEKPEYMNRLKNSADIEELVTAAENNDVSKVMEVLQHNPNNVNVVDKADSNRTLLHLAAKYNYVDLAKMLIEKFNADYDLTDDIGDTPLYTAMAFDNDEVADYLADLYESESEEEKNIEMAHKQPKILNQ